MASLPSSVCLLTLAGLVRVCSKSEFGSSTQDDTGLPKLVSLAIRGRCRLAKGNDSGGEEGREMNQT